MLAGKYSLVPDPGMTWRQAVGSANAKVLRSPAVSKHPTATSFSSDAADTLVFFSLAPTKFFLFFLSCNISEYLAFDVILGIPRALAWSRECLIYSYSRCPSRPR